jgi:hypothetical protein
LTESKPARQLFPPDLKMLQPLDGKKSAAPGADCSALVVRNSRFASLPPLRAQRLIRLRVNQALSIGVLALINSYGCKL